MPSLKDLKNRIGSVKSTQKITSAMKMVAAAKLRKAQEQAVSSRPYCSGMENIVSSLSVKLENSAPILLQGKNDIKKHIMEKAIKYTEIRIKKNLSNKQNLKLVENSIINIPKNFF